jgi:hypothetical protein
MPPIYENMRDKMLESMVSYGRHEQGKGRGAQIVSP